jgi:hypothetical protein
MMKDRTVLIGLLCAGTLCVGALQAQEANGAKGKPGRPPPHVAGSATNRFAAIDTNTNGVISLDEFKAMLAKREEGIKQRMGDTYDAALAAKKPSAEEVFKKLDTDGNGTLTKQEMDAERMPKGPRPPRGDGGKKPEAPAAGAVVTP